MAAAKRWTQWMLRTALLVSALFLAARTFAGPLTWPIAFRSPLNFESAIGLSVSLILLLRAGTGLTAEQAGRRARPALDAFLILLMAGLIASVFWQSANFYFLSDDFVLLKQARLFSFTLRGLFGNTGADGAYRPVTHFYMSVAYQWAKTSPADWHALELAIHTVNSVLVYVIARMLMFSQFGAAFAACLFAVHATRPEAVVWLAGRADLLAAFFVLLGLLLFIRFWNRSGTVAWSYYVVSLLSMTFGILSKESAYPFAFLLIVFLVSKKALMTCRAFQALTPFFLVSAALFAWRIVLFGGIGGYRGQTGHSEAWSMRLIPMLKALLLRLDAVLFFPVNWSHDAGPVFGIAMILYLASLLWLTRSCIPRDAFLIPLGFLFILVLPVLPQLLIGMDLQKARLLYLPAAGFCWMLATAVDYLRSKYRWAVAIAILLFNIAALGHNLNAWEEASRLARAACNTAAFCSARGAATVAVQGLPGSWNGVYFFANGFPECVEMQRSGIASAIDLKDPNQPIDRSQYECVLSWNSQSGTLSQVPYDNH